MKTGVYLHIPFCRAKCDYCDFYSVSVASFPSGILDRYVERLVTDIKERLSIAEQPLIDTIYFGGGSPSIIPPDYIYRIIDTVSSSASPDNPVEITIEINPCDISPEKTDALVSAGINRFSVGIQSFNIGFLHGIGRGFPEFDRAAVGDLFSRKGIIRSLDIICGSSPGVVLSDLREAMKLNPDHISLYMLSIEKHTPLGARLVPDDSFETGRIKAFEAAADLLRKEGYIHYEISNFAKKGMESKHNMKYWLFEPYIGFGPSSHTFYGGERGFCSADIHRYLSGKECIHENDPRSVQQIIAEYVMTSIRLIEGFGIDSFQKKLGLEPPETLLLKLPGLQSSGYLDNSCPDRVKLTWKGILWSDYVIYELVEGIL